MRLVDRYGNSINDNNQVTLWTGSYNSKLQSITLSDNIFNYDVLLFNDEQTGMYYTIALVVMKGQSIQRTSGINSNGGTITIALDKCSTTSNVVELHTEYFAMGSTSGGNVKIQKIIGITL